MKPIKLYFRRTCPYCIRAKAYLDKKGFVYELIDLSNKPEELAALKKRTGWRTVPQIFFGDTLIGGCDELLALDAQGKIEQMLQAS